MKKEELDELLKSPDFNPMVKMTKGYDPCNLRISCYRERRDIYIREAFGNYFFDIKPYYSGLSHHENLKNKECDRFLYIGTNIKEKRDPTEGTISKDELYKLINEYLEELEISAKLEIENMNKIINKIPKLKS